MRPLLLCLVFISLVHAQTSDLFISEYVEGSSYNKAVELYNGTGIDVDLSDYSVELFTNGDTTAHSTLELSGVLVNGDVYVIAHGSANENILNEADTTSGVVNFNGDDAIALVRSKVIIDIVGVMGEDPGTEWGEGYLSTADNTLRRKSTMCSGTTTFNFSEWDGFQQDTFDGLGAHTADCGHVDVTSIHDIQLTEDPSGNSPLNNQTNITTEGVVTALFSGGYFIQDGIGEWSGLWISDGTNTPTLGDLVRITGTVSEISSMTALNSLSDFVTMSSGNSLPSEELLPTGDVADERWEGVLVQVENATVTSADLGNGDWTVNDGSGDTGIGTKGSISYSPAVDDEFDFIRGPVDFCDSEFVVQPRDDDDLKLHVEFSIVINEIHADPDPVLGDANGDGECNNDDEFVEIVNASDIAVDISNWTLSDAASVTHIFPEGTILNAHSAIVVFDGGDLETVGDCGGALVQFANDGALSLNNDSDTITLNDGVSDQASVTYGSEAGDNQSITRGPDITGESFVKHSHVADDSALFSPGTYADGYCFHADLIHDVQGFDTISPLDGSAGVLVEGVVTADFQSADELGGFFLQEETPQMDEHESTSEGIFVYDDGFGVDVNIGDIVRITGTVNEYYDKTQLSDVTEIVVVRQQSVPNATVVTLPKTRDELEAYEGMLITIDQELTTSGNHNLAGYGEVELSCNGRLYSPTNCAAPGDDANCRSNENKCRRIQLDDGSRISDPDPTPYLTNSTLRLGSTLPSLTGVLDFSFDCFEIHPTQAVSFIDANPRTTAPESMNAALKAVSFNLNNFFNGDGQGGDFPTPRGAENYNEYVDQRQKLISTLISIDADLLGLNEMENDGFGQYSAIQDLVDGLNESTAENTYAFIDPGIEQIGDDEVTSGIIYKPVMLTPLGALAILDNSVDPMFDPTNRPSLAQTFQDTCGEVFTFIVNHFRSKSSPCDGDEDKGDGQGHCNQTRTDAAAALCTWLDTDPTSSNDPDFLIVGDLNAFPYEDPISVLKDAGYLNLVDDKIGDTAYTSVYDAQSGYLDHAFVSASLNSQIHDVTIWHINADEPENVNVENSGMTTMGSDDPYRSSDHDPIVVGFELQPISIQLTLFEATFAEAQVTINWQTESEINIAGFNILRSETESGTFIKINTDHIPSEGDSGRGAAYKFVDVSGLPMVYYKLETITLDGQSEFYGPIEVVDTGVHMNVLPTTFALYENYPNPFNPSTIIRYDVPHPEHVVIRIYDITGRLVRTLVDEQRQAGSFEMMWTGLNNLNQHISSGLYFFEMRAGDFIDIKKMTLLR